jgi:hypothetical protein
MVVDASDQCTLATRFLRFAQDRSDLMQYVLFSLRNLLETVEFNTRESEYTDAEGCTHESLRRFERTVWTNKLDQEDIAAFKSWLAEHGQDFLQQANVFISARGQSEKEGTTDRPVIGVGMYFYEQDSDS